MSCQDRFDRIPVSVCLSLLNLFYIAHMSHGAQFTVVEASPDRPFCFYTLSSHPNQYSDETEEEMMMKQLQNEADRNPVAADVLEEIVRVKSMKEMQGVKDEKQTSAAANFHNVGHTDLDADSDIIKTLKKQLDKNPAAAEIVRDMEMMEKLKDEGHIAPIEKQSIMEQVRVNCITVVDLKF